MAAFDAAIPPGEAGKVTAQVHTENYRGPVEKAITLTSSDLSRPMIQLRIKANIVGSVELIPSWQVILPSMPDWTYSSRLIVRKEQSEKGDLAVSDVTSSVPWLTAKARKVKEPVAETPGNPAQEKGDWVLDLKVTDEAPVGQTGQTVKFKTGLPREAEISIPISVVIQQAMHLKPVSLNLPIIPGEATARNVFHLKVRPGLGSQTPIVRVAPAVFSVKLEPDGDHEYKGTVVWTPQGEESERTGEVALSMGSENLSLPLRVTTLPPGVDPKRLPPDAIPPATPPAAPAQAKPAPAPAGASHPSSGGIDP